MSIRTFARLGALPVATAAIALSLVQPASAHVTVSPSSAAAGDYTVATFSVGHGCEAGMLQAFAAALIGVLMVVVATLTMVFNKAVSFNRLIGRGA